MTEFDTRGKARDELERRASRRAWRPGLRESALFDRNVIHEIQRAAREGIYDIRGFGAKRAVPHFDDLLFLGASMSRYPLEGYRERCDTDVVLGARHASKPLHLDIPVTIAGMSFGALSAPAKEALGRGVLLGQKISDRVADMRDLPKGIDQRSACRHPDWTGPDELEIKIHELRENTDWEQPVFVKVGA